MRRTASNSLAGRFQIFAWAFLCWCCVIPAVRAQSPRETAESPRPVRGDLSDNTYLAIPVLPEELRRVAVLPLSSEGSQSDLASGCETFEPILLSELEKTKKFDVVSVHPESLRQLTGRLSWTGDEVLPADFFGALRRVYGCDAVLFCQLSEFRAYAPMAVGWRMKLVDAHTGEILWASDKLYDTQDGSLRQARHDYSSGLPFWHNAGDDWTVANSPRLFGRFTLGRALATLPARQPGGLR